MIGAGYRINWLVSVGATFQYGYGQVKDEACPSGVSCKATDYRLSIDVRFHFLTQQTFSPWVSAGLGYEWLTIRLSQGGQSASATLRGRELLNLEGGGDFRVSPFFTLGPFVGLQVSEYDHVSDDTISEDIPNDNQSFHGWIVLGIRGTFTL
jgi:opacity protein-like surface antigen